MKFAGIDRVAYDQRNGKPTRIVSDNHGMAIRVDELWSLYNLASGTGRMVAGLSGGGAPGRHTDVPFVLSHEQDYLHDACMAFPKDWNGETLIS